MPIRTPFDDSVNLRRMTEEFGKPTPNMKVVAREQRKIAAKTFGNLAAGALVVIGAVVVVQSIHMALTGETTDPE